MADGSLKQSIQRLGIPHKMLGNEDSMPAENEILLAMIKDHFALFVLSLEGSDTTRRAAVRNMPPIRSARKWKH